MENLKKAWLLIPAKLKGRKIVGYIYNSVHYAGDVNYGHRTRLGTGKIKSKAFGKKYVPSVNFLEQAFKRSRIKTKISKEKGF